MPSTLFAQLHDMSFKSPKGFANAYIAHRMVLRRAKRFTMDAELGQQVEELAETAGERLKEWMQLARLPYADVWIERDAPTGKIGILASRHPTLPTRWKASVFIGAEYDPYRLRRWRLSSIPRPDPRTTSSTKVSRCRCRTNTRT